MTDLRELLLREIREEFVCRQDDESHYCPNCDNVIDRGSKLRNRIDAALAQQQEPVAFHMHADKTTFTKKDVEAITTLAVAASRQFAPSVAQIKAQALREAADMVDGFSQPIGPRADIVDKLRRMASEHEREESPQTAAQLHDWHKRRKPTGNQP